MDAAAGAPLPASSVFDETLQRFMRNLDPVDVDWLGRITASSWEPLIVYLEALNRNHRNSSGARKLLSRVRCFVDTLRPFLGCVDMVVSSNGSIVGIIWGSLRVLIEITHKFTEYFSIISDTLETISVELPIFQDYVEKLYTESHTVQKAVAIVFEDILTVFLSIRNTFIDSQGHPRSSLCISLKAFRQDMEKIIMHLEKHRKIVEVHVEHAERMANKEEREESVQSRRRLEAKILSDEKRASELTFYQRIEKFQALLDAPKCWGKHATTVQVYKQPQCWLLNNHQYKKWSTQNCGLLWCHSKPGAGKTVLSSVIINELQQTYREDPDVTVVFFYCEYNDPVKRITSKIVASILDQLMYDPKVLALVEETWMNKSPNLQHLGLENLQDLIVQLLQQSQHTYIIVDALDECDHPDDVASILQDLAKHASILVTSRSESEDIDAALGHHPQIHITSESLQHDINHFVTSSLERHRRISKRSVEIKQHIAEVLVESADGMFLWVTLMIELLANQMTDHGILSALLQLPIGLTATYFRILTKIDQLPSRRWCLRVITWILCARRPLELSELITGIAIADMDESTTWDVTKVPSNPYDVIFDCNGLVSCTPTLHGVTVQFTHTSVRDFLLTNPLEVVSTLPAYHIFPKSKGHTVLADWCLTYLVLRNKTESKSSGPTYFQKPSDSTHLNLFTYVKSYWNVHIEESKSPELLKTFDQVLSAPDVLGSFGGGSPLHVALKYNLPFIVEHLLRTQGDLALPDLQSNTALHLAVVNPGWVQILLAQKVDIHARNMHGMTPLHMATNMPHLPIEKAGLVTNLASSVAILIGSGANISSKDGKGQTPLHLAAGSGQIECMSCLIMNGAKIMAVDNLGLTPLHHAAKNGVLRAVQLLLDFAADINVKDHNLWTPVHLVSRLGHVQVMQAILDRGADLEMHCQDGMTPLHFAVLSGNAEMVKLLLKGGADANRIDSVNSTPLHYAAAEGNPEIVQSLINNGAQLNIVDDDDMLPMHHAAEYGHYQVIKLLLEHGDDINCRTELNLTPLHYAAKHDKRETVIFLIEHGADTGTVNTEELTPLHYAVDKGELETMILLVKHGANINGTTLNQWTALHFASANGQLDAVTTLYQLGADLNASTTNHSTAFHIASWHGHADICKFLLGQLLSLRDIFTKEYAPIHLAAWQGNLDVLRLLIANGTDVNLRAVYGWTPVHLAAWTGCTEAVKFLAENGAQIQAVTASDHWTPLHLAAWKGNVNTLRYLLETGVDINRCSKAGVTALRLAIQNRQVITAGVLLEEREGSIDIGIDTVDTLPHHFMEPEYSYQFPTVPNI